MGPSAEERRAGRWWLAAALGLALLAYWQTQHFSFSAEDHQRIKDNPRIQYTRFLPSYFTEHSETHVNAVAPGNTYRPVSLLWRSVNHTLWGPLAAGWHWTSLAMHLLTVALVFALTGAWMRDTQIAGVTALLFALHPVNVEAVAWISGVDEALAAAPILACAYFFLHWSETRRAEQLVVSLACCFVALLAKESALVLPFLLLAMDLLRGSANEGAEPVQRSRAQRVSASLRNVTPFFAVAVVYLAVRWLALGGVMPASTAPAASLAINAPLTFLFHLRLLIWPTGLSHFYDVVQMREPTLATASLAAIVLLGVGAALLLAGRRWPWFAKSALWMALPLAAIVILPADAEVLQDRYAYLPSVGFCMLLAAVMRNLPGIQIAGKQSYPGALALPFLLAALLGAATATQAEHWRNNEAVFSRGIRLNPEDARATVGWADELLAQGRVEDAALQYAKVQARHPENARGHFGTGNLLYLQKRYSEAVPHLERAATLDRSHSEARVKLAQIRFREQNFPESERLLREGLALRPSQPGYRFVLATILEMQKRPREALQAYREELRFDPWRAFTEERIARLLKENPALAPASGNPPQPR